MVSAEVSPVKRIRVARVITRLNVGGPAIQAMLLTSNLDPERFDTILVTGRVGLREGDMSELRPQSGVIPIVIPSLGRDISIWRDMRTLIALIRLFRRWRPDIVHTHLAKAGLLGRLAAWIVRVPVVVHTFHGNVLRGYFGSISSRLFLALERLLAHVTTRVIAISDRQAAEIRELGIARYPRLVRIPLGLDLAPFLASPRGRIRALLGLGESVPLVGIVARLVPIKGIPLFLEGARLIVDADDAIRFVIVGDGPDRDRSVQLAQKLGLADHVFFVGWLADLPGVYADLDVLVLTSHNEGTPVSLIEGLAASRPVVATDVGGVSDVVTPECGILVPPGDPRAFAREVLGLLRDPVRRERLGAAGRATVYPRYDASSLVREIDDLYTGLVATIPK